MSLRLVNLEPGDEVITTTITDMGSIIGILSCNLIPTFADVDPRTALGFSRDGRYAILVTVDGREAFGDGGRTGMSFTEVATILVRNGAWIGSNQDGGGCIDHPRHTR